MQRIIRVYKIECGIQISFNFFRLLDLVENAGKYRTDPDAKPPFSYATMICLAMRANNNKVSLSNIYAWIRENFLFYKYADPAWQVKEILYFSQICS